MLIKLGFIGVWNSCIVMRKDFWDYKVAVSRYCFENCCMYHWVWYSSDNLSSQWCSNMNKIHPLWPSGSILDAWITVTPFWLLSDLKDIIYLKSFNSCCPEDGTFSEHIKQNGNKTIAYLLQISSPTSLLTELQFYPYNSQVTLSQAWE